MDNRLKQRFEIPAEYKWDLSSLFTDDEAFERSLKQIGSSFEQISAFKGKLDNAETIASYLQTVNDIDRRMNDLYVYSMLRKNENTADEKAQSMNSRAMAEYVRFSAANSFAMPELLSLSKEKLNELLKEEKLADYRFFLEKMIRQKDHTLSVKEESLLANFADVLNGSADISAYLMDADMTFEKVSDSKGVFHELNGSNFVYLQSLGDRVLAENAFKSYYKAFREHINTFSCSYAKTVQKAVTEARIRSYDSSRQMMMSRSDIPAGVYDRLITAVRRHLPAMYRYVKLRKKLLKLDELHYYDLYQPLLSQDGHEYSYEQAQELILDALQVLGKDYTDKVRSAFAEGWIDVYPNKGKRGGAFSSGTYDSNPYILTNYTGTLDAVSTIAHEMGHSMHTYYANSHQPYHYADYTLFVAEVASTVNENLLIEHLLSLEKDPKARLRLLNQYLENFKGTVYRQTMFAEFEMKAHQAVESGGALTPAVLNAIYLDLIKDYFGEELVIDEEVSLEWARIPHFYRPFYVYVYATGYATAVALSEGMLERGEEAVKRYLEFLAMGSSRYPLDELRHAGVDLDSEGPIDTALEKFEKVLAEAEQIADELMD